MSPRKLSAQDKAALTDHLIRLQGEDRRLRFAATVTDDFIRRYINETFDEKSKWLGVDGKPGELVAACHVAFYDGQAELGCSVDQGYRGHKLAQKMFDRAVTVLRSKGITKVFMNCLSENKAMKHIAKKNQMTVVSYDGDAEARVTIESPTPVAPLHDAYLDRMALYDTLIRGQYNLLRSLFT